MAIVLTLLFELTVPIVVGLFATRYLKAVLWQVLVDLCGTTERAEFWARVSAVLFTATPLLLVMITSNVPAVCSSDDTACFIGLLRGTVISTLLGMLVAVCGVAMIIGRYVPREARIAQPIPAPEVTE